MDTITKKILEWKYNPLQFVLDNIECKPTKQQVHMLSNFVKAKRNTIRSGHGTGKDASASWLIWWFLCTRPFAKVVCTAPTFRQLSDILWSELSKWGRRSKGNLADEFVIQKDKIFHKSAPKEHWCRAVSVSVKASKDEQAETLAGFHGDHLLIVVDEASGVPDPVFIPLEGAMTQEDNWCLMIGNMTRNTGYFYETHFHETISKKWQKFHWDSRESENVKPSMIEYFKDKYGEDSDVFRVRVMGEPPTAESESFIPLSWAIACINSGVEASAEDPLYLGVDVGRYGDDPSIILPRRGNVIEPWDTIKSVDVITLGGFVKQNLAELDAGGAAIDEIGIGAGVVDWLEKFKTPNVYGVNVSRKSSDKTKYDRLRDELWTQMREKCMKRYYNFPSGELGNELANELSSPHYSFNAYGGFKVESKIKMRARGVASPNIADALGLTEYFYTVAHLLFNPTKKKKVKPRPWELQNRKQRKGRHLWAVK